MFVKKVLTKKYQKNTEFYADFKSVEIIGKKYTQKKLFAKNFCTVSSIEERNPIFCL